MLECSEISSMYSGKRAAVKTPVQGLDKVEQWMRDNEEPAGAMQVPPPLPRAPMACVTIRKQEVDPTKTGIKWLLPAVLTSVPEEDNSENTEDTEVLMEDQAGSPSTPSPTVVTYTMRTQTEAPTPWHIASMSDRDPNPEVTPASELVTNWTEPVVEQGYWPLVAECSLASGCPCWNCFHGCNLKLPASIMAPILEKEMGRLEKGNQYWERKGICWDDLAAIDREEEGYHSDDFEPFMVYDNEAGCKVLQVSPEMGITHKHVQVEYPNGGLTGEVRVIQTGYFMVLTPPGVEEDEEEHAVEALRVTWGTGMVSQVDVLVRNPKKRVRAEKLTSRPRWLHRLAQPAPRGNHARLHLPGQWGKQDTRTRLRRTG
jgi:hypothetical protein